MLIPFCLPVPVYMEMLNLTKTRNDLLWKILKNTKQLKRNTKIQNVLPKWSIHNMN